MSSKVVWLAIYAAVIILGLLFWWIVSIGGTTS